MIVCTKLSKSDIASKEIPEIKQVTNIVTNKIVVYIISQYYEFINIIFHLTTVTDILDDHRDIYPQFVVVFSSSKVGFGDSLLWVKA